MTIALQMAVLAALMVGLGLIVRWGQLYVRATYLAGRIAASMVGIVVLPFVLPLLGARSGNEARTYVMGGVFGYAGFWLAHRISRPTRRADRRRDR